MFGKKSIKCSYCNEKISDSYSFCPYCGNPAEAGQKANSEDYGLLGKDNLEGMPSDNSGFGFTDKIMGSLVNSLMKNLDKQFRQMDKDIETAEVKSFPNGIRIKIGPGQMPQRKAAIQKNPFTKKITDKQIERMSALPREEAKSNVKRIGDKIVYELEAPGIESPQDVFVSKLESGYEIKAIADKKVYVNSLPVNLPLQKLSFVNNKLFVEFEATHQNI